MALTISGLSKTYPNGDQPPTRAGIDPYNKLIDRISDDNMIDVTGL